MKNSFLVTAISACVLSGCSSIVGKSNYDVVIDSNPTAANYVITNRAGQKVSSGVTPATVNLKSSSAYFKGETYTVQLNKSGYPDTAYKINSSLDGWYWGNILIGGLIGMLIVDPMTGAMYKLPESAYIPMKPGDLLLRKGAEASASTAPAAANDADSASGTDAEANPNNGKYVFPAEVAVRNADCARTVTLESAEPFREVYSATCTDGRKLLVECNGGTCAIQ